MQCRVGCGACCTAVSISSPIPGMAGGKPAGVPCIHLTEDRRCALFGLPERPQICIDFTATPEFCGSTREEAEHLLTALERETTPDVQPGTISTSV